MLDIKHAFRKTTIGSNEYQLVLLKGREGFTTALTLAKLLAPVLGTVFDGVKHDDYIHGAPKTFQDMALLLVNQLDKVDIEVIIFDKLLRGLACNGAAVTEAHWMGNYSELIELVVFALQENFGDFFGANGFKARFQETVKNVVNLT
jgi:hypothetical protein